MQNPSHSQGRWGLALFLGRGFSAWMQAWTQVTPAKDPSSIRAIATGEPVRLPNHVETQMVSALASMVLDALRKEAA
jgi:hypothetical protein